MAAAQHDNEHADPGGDAIARVAQAGALAASVAEALLRLRAERLRSPVEQAAAPPGRSRGVPSLDRAAARLDRLGSSGKAAPATRSEAAAAAQRRGGARTDTPRPARGWPERLAELRAGRSARPAPRRTSPARSGPQPNSPANRRAAANERPDRGAAATAGLPTARAAQPSRPGRR